MTHDAMRCRAAAGEHCVALVGLLGAYQPRRYYIRIQIAIDRSIWMLPVLLARFVLFE